MLVDKGLRASYTKLSLKIVFTISNSIKVASLNLRKGIVVMDKVTQFLGNPITQSVLGFIYGIILPIFLYRRAMKHGSSQNTSSQERPNQITCLGILLLMLLTLVLIFLLNRIAKVSYFTFFSAVIGSLLTIGVYLIIANIRKNKEEV
jgi:hypothetical protein